jgi:tRNA modification GTPase
LALSAKTGKGLEKLKQLIADRLSDRAVSFESDLMVLQARHDSALRRAREFLDEVIELLEPLEEGAPLKEPELIASALRASLNELAALAGDITPDDVLGKVFASFCVGK